MIDDILSQVHKPGRYIGGEWNVSRKDFESAAIKFALCFPDLYEVGMSNLGIRILYGILNDLDGVCCERFFSVAQDMENILRAAGTDIFSLESRRRLNDFDLVGFSLGYELSYTNVLNILELGGIPLLSSERDCRYPLVIAGGPCVLNPEPMHEFFDLFVIGEAEEVISEIVDVYRRLKDKFKKAKITKDELLLEFSRTEGVYVPSLYDVSYTASGEIEEFRPKVEGLPQRISKRFIRDLNSAYFPSQWLLPYIQIVHDRITLEVMRGCPNNCSFCQARSQYYPFRKRGKEQILSLASQAYQCTGYEEMALGGLSVSDYPGIEELLQELLVPFKEKGVSISLPSIKPRMLVGNLSSLIAGVKKTGLTFAPEAASERMRKALNKDFSVSDFFAAIEQAYISGYQRIKLYFMIGLPHETEEDLDAILDFALQVSELRRKIKQRPAQVNISVNTLIPKPHTAFQRLGMEGIESIRQKQDYLRKKLRNRRLELNFHSPNMSFLEAVFSRGDRKLSRVVVSAFKKGARFDAWSNLFLFEKWSEAFRECGIDPGSYLRQRTKQEILPWDFLDIGIPKQALEKDTAVC